MNDWRARIGFLIPPTNPTVEKEMFELAPQGVSVHFARMVAKGPVGTLDNLHQRAASHIEHLAQTIEMLASVEPDVIVLAHTATSYILGPKGERELTVRMEKLTGIPFISALGSAVKAFEVMGLKKIAIGTAYDQALTLKGKSTLQAHGLQVVHAECLPDVKSIFDETDKRVYSLAKSANRAQAQAVFLSGVGLPTISLLEALEDDLNKPVISSCSAMMWNAMRVAGVGAPVFGYGGLLEDTQLRHPSKSKSKK